MEVKDLKTFHAEKDRFLNKRTIYWPLELVFMPKKREKHLNEEDVKNYICGCLYRENGNRLDVLKEKVQKMFKITEYDTEVHIRSLLQKREITKTGHILMLQS